MATDNEPIAGKKAVALTYDAKNDSAPKVSAKGTCFVAEQIIALAEEHDIEVHKDKDLVEVLSALEVDSIIPVEAYSAVAEILSYIYKKNAQERANI